MKTRLTHFISIIAIGFLFIFCPGCASLTIPERPVDLRGEGMVRAKGDKIAVSSKLAVSGSLSVSGYAPGQGSMKGSGRFSGARSNDTEIEVTEVNGEGRVTELYAFKIMQPYSLKARVSAQGKTQNMDDEGEGSQHGNEYTMENDKGEWDSPFAALQGIFADPNLFPEKKIPGGHMWKPEGDLFEDILEAVPDMPGQARGMKPDGVDVEVIFKFKGLKEYRGENCAVIDIDVSGGGKDPNSNAKLTVTGDGEIYRSLDSCRNLKAWTKVRIKGGGTERQGGARMSVSISMAISIKEKEEMIHKADPVPGKTDAESKEQIGEDK